MVSGFGFNLARIYMVETIHLALVWSQQSSIWWVKNYSYFLRNSQSIWYYNISWTISVPLVNSLFVATCRNKYLHLNARRIICVEPPHSSCGSCTPSRGCGGRLALSGGWSRRWSSSSTTRRRSAGWRASSATSYAGRTWWSRLKGNIRRLGDSFYGHVFISCFVLHITLEYTS